eukprot:11820568-Ditylum_brightwellii.AAC.1
MTNSAVEKWGQAIADKNNGPMAYLYRFKPNFKYEGDKAGDELLPWDNFFVDAEVELLAWTLYASAFDG